MVLQEEENMTGDARLDPAEAIDAVSRRAAIIECLVDGPKYNRDLREELDISRSTAYKAVTELEELNIAQRGDDGYQLTVLGQLLFEQYRAFRGRVTEVCRAGDLLAVLPRDTEIPFSVLKGADVSKSKPHAPNRPVQEIERLVDDATRVRGTGPVVLPRYVEIFAEQILSNELEAELIYAQPVFQHLLDVYEQDFTATVQSDNLVAWVTSADLPYALLLIDEPTHQVAIVVYDNGGEIRGLIVSDSEAAYAWASDQWEQFCQAAAHPSIEISE